MAKNPRLLWLLFGLSVVALVLFGAWQIEKVLPPSSIRLGTGPEGEQEYQMALQYQRYMANEAVAVEIVPTAGSLEVMERLQAGEVDAGFILNASNLLIDSTDSVTTTGLAEGLVGIAAVGYMPQWIFYRGELEGEGPMNGLEDLEGLRVAMGQPQSGTRAIGTFLLRISDIDPGDLTIVDASPQQGAEMLLAGEVDAMFLSSGFDSPTVSTLLNASDVEILNLELAPTYARMIPLLEEIVFLRGSVTISSMRPPDDKHMLAVASLLVSQSDLSPDIQILLTRAARDAQRRMFDPFASSDTFPTVDGLTVPASPVTTRFINEGVTLLQRYLPFWIASPLERFYVLILPLVLLLYPIVTKSPLAYGYVMRSRINKWYKRLREIELEIPRLDAATTAARMAELRSVRSELTERLKVSTGYLWQVYDLRNHIDQVLDLLEEHAAQLSPLPVQS